MKGVLYALKL